MAELPERDTALLLDMREIVGMRHRLIHGYGDVRLDLIWKVTHEHLIPLMATLEEIFPISGKDSR